MSLDDRRLIPRTLLEPHPDNRQHRNPEADAELHADIQARGILDDLLVRPIPGRDGSDGQPLYQIVSGERRWRASEGTPVEMALPCKVRQLSDLEALEILLIPNIQREQLHPLDEAIGYERLLLDAPAWVHHDRPRLQGYNLDELAAKVHKDRRHIVARLRLLGLTRDARKAFYDRDFGIEGALHIARLNTMAQAEIVQGLLHDAERGAPWSADTIAHMCRTRYMLRLAGAPFDLADAELVPAAGNCTSCSKRSGANPELFDDISEADTCADPHCFRVKCAAHVDRALEHAMANGQQVIVGDEAAKLLPSPDGTIKGYLRLDKPSELATSDKPLRDLVVDRNDHNITVVARSLGSDEPTVVVELMPAPYVRKLLADKGLLRKKDQPAPAPAPASGKPPKERTAQAAANGAAREPGEPAADDAAPAEDPLLEQWLSAFTVLPGHILSAKPKRTPSPAQVSTYERSALWRAEAFLAGHRVARALAVDGAYGFPSEGVSQLIARIALIDHDVDERVLVALAGIPTEVVVGNSTQRIGRHWVWSLDDEQAARLALVALAGVNLVDMGKHDPAPHTLVTASIGIDGSDIAAKAKALVKERLQIELLSLAPKASTKQAPAKNGAAIKYRNPRTGETWSGRGLQPKWLKASLALGHTLADFEVAARPKAAPKPKAAPAPAAVARPVEPVGAWPFPTGNKP